ncbi:MAG TPA: type II secretion system F family protein [Blastocatellia bacterium]|nr:type II secretion system F family protein [Blastocatellia bacterium]
MPTFVYKGRNRMNEIVTGERVAENRETLERLLRRDQVILTSAREKGKELALPKLGGGGSVGAKDLSIFTRQFSVMIDAGLPLVQCLDILAEQQPNKFFKQALTNIRNDVESGMTLADSMAKQPKAFDRLYTNMVAAGETGGILDLILQRLAVYIEKAVKLKGDVKSALIYPVAVIVIAIMVISVIMIFVIPAFTKIFQELLGPGELLPLPTRIVVGISHFMASYWWIGAALIAAMVWAVKMYYRTPGGKKVIDTMMLKMPVFGSVLRKVAVARFARTLSTLLSSGVPILESLDITAKTAGNVVITEAITRVREGVERGQTFVEPLRATQVFPNMVAQMVGIGEQTGAMDAMLGKIADFYEQEVDTAVKQMLTLIEPIMIGFLGVTIGGIVISMYLPLFTLIGKMSGGH